MRFLSSGILIFCLLGYLVLFSACAGRMTVEEAKRTLETHRKRYQAAIRASESAKKQMKQAEKDYKEASNKFKRSSDACDKQEKMNIKKITKEFSVQIKNKQKELRELEHKIKSTSQNLM